MFLSEVINDSIDNRITDYAMLIDIVAIFAISTNIIYRLYLVGIKDNHMVGLATSISDILQDKTIITLSLGFLGLQIREVGLTSFVNGLTCIISDTISEPVVTFHINDLGVTNIKIDWHDIAVFPVITVLIGDKVTILVIHRPTTSKGLGKFLTTGEHSHTCRL